jgi:hypothetical protein
MDYVFSLSTGTCTAACPKILQLLFLGLLFTSFQLCSDESDCKDSEQSVKSKEDESKKCEEQKKEGETKEDITKEKEETKPKKEEPPKIGMFSLPTSQQPSALFGFGGNIIDKGEVQIYFFADDFKGKKK